MSIPELNTKRTTCPYCGVGCGIEVTFDGDPQSARIAGDLNHPANHGRLCSKGAALAQTLELNHRLITPVVNGQSSTWTNATGLIARRFTDSIRDYGKDSVAFYVSGQLLTEDYYVANKLMKGYIGSANIDTNSRLCMASSVAGHKRAFGADIVPGCYEDFELADLVVLVGSNLAWCHPVLYQRLTDARKANPKLKLVVIDPRRTLTADSADLFLPIKSDSDVDLFNALLAYLYQHDCVDQAWIDRYTSGDTECQYKLQMTDMSKLSVVTACAAQAIQTFFDWFAQTEKVLTVYSQGVNQSITGTDKVNSIINCHLATGRIGKPGAGPFSVTGQPNAMGGREVGGLSNMLACHMNVAEPTHQDLVRRFWSSPTIATEEGLKAVSLFQAIESKRVRAVWIMGTNPVTSLPNADLVKRALHACEFVVVSDVVKRNDTIDCANVVLPALAWGEKDGTVTNSERCISRQRAFRKPPGQAKPDWWALSQVALAMGFKQGFKFNTPCQIFTEHAQLSGFENKGERAFDISAMWDLSEAQYDQLKPFYWPCAKHSSSVRASPDAGAPRQPIRLFAKGNFCFSDKLARFVSVAGSSDVQPASKTVDDGLKPAQQLTLNTGRIRDQWHTMTRTGYCERLSSHMPEPFAEIHPADAVAYGVEASDIVAIKSESIDLNRAQFSAGYNQVLVRAVITDRVSQGTIFVPMHWSDQFASAARVGVLISSLTDPVSGQPGLKHSPVHIHRFAAELYGFALISGYNTDSVKRLREFFTANDVDYWSLALHGEYLALKYATSAQISEVDCFNQGLVASVIDKKPIRASLNFCDNAKSVNRAIALSNSNTLAWLNYTSKIPITIDRNWLLTAVNSDCLDLMSVISGRPGTGGRFTGPLICSCFGIGEKTIQSCIDSGDRDLQMIGNATGAGTGCGSCQPEIEKIIRFQQEHRCTEADLLTAT